MAGNDCRVLTLRINGREFHVQPDTANVPLAAFIKAKTHFKSVKIACGEGGCGACTVAVEEELDGHPHLRTINSCLAPVYSLLGRSVLTAEGLPAATPEGTSLVAERLSEFHASQCGFCTPGFTVACHAALHNAAATGSSPAAAEEGAAKAPGPGRDAHGATTGGGTCGGCPTVGADGGGEGGGKRGGSPLLVAEGALLRALDGNLCRCTGYRPIVAACRSLAADVKDIEDLCSRRTTSTAGAQPQRASTAPAAAAFAASNGGGAVNGASAGDRLPMVEVALGAGQVLKVPRTLEQLLAEAGRLAAAAALPSPGPPGPSSPSSPSSVAPPSAGRSWRLVAGHTGHGVFKDWPVEEAVLLSVMEVPELRRLELVTAGGAGDGSRAQEDTAATPTPTLLHIGACTTLERLAAYLAAMAEQPDDGDLKAAAMGAAAAEAPEGGEAAAGGKAAAAKVAAAAAAAAAGAFGVRQWAAETSSHLYRIAGRHVRNSATVGGNLSLARERCLPSDVATLLAAAGAEVEVVTVSSDAATHGSVVRADLLQFVSGAAPALPAGASYILTAVLVPLPPADPRVRFWSQRIGERYSNAAAVANAAILISLSAAAPPPPLPYTSNPYGNHDAPVVGEVRIVVGVRTPGGGAAAPRSVSEHNAAKLHDASAVLLDGWRCLRAAAAEAELRNRPATAATVAAALEALAASDMAETAAAAAGDESSAVAAAALIAQGLVAQGLMACLGLSLAPTAAGAHADRCKAAAAGDGKVLRVDAVAVVDADGGAIGNGDSGEDVAVQCGVNGNSGADDSHDGNVAAAPAGSEFEFGPVPPNAKDGKAPATRQLPLAALSPPPARMPPPPLVTGRQSLPESVPELHPVTLAVPKLASKLQASGTAHYTEDVPVHTGALYGAFVLSARAGGRLAGVDVSAALSLPGVYRFLGAADLAAVGPAGALNICEPQSRSAPEPSFLSVGARCDFAGQVVGLLLADSPWSAQRGAKAVRVTYGSGDGDGDKPLLSIADAVHARSFYALPPIAPLAPGGNTYGDNVTYLCKGGGDVDQVLTEAATPAAATMTAAALGAQGAAAAGTTAVAAPPAPPSAPSRFRVVSGRYGTPSQLHFYLETQSAVAWPDEDGCVVVHSSCQGPDSVQAGVAAALQLPLNKVLVRCRRVGGGFGGKVTFARRVAVVAAIAAVATGRQVRIAVPRNTDFAMCGGRCDADVSYVAVLDEQEVEKDQQCKRDPDVAESDDQSPPPPPPSLRLRALDLHVVLQGGAFLDLGFVDAIGLLMSVDSVYYIPAIRLEIALARCNLPPRTAVRGPGEITGTMVIEQVMEHVAAELGLDPEALREANFARPQPPPPPPAQDQATPSVTAPAADPVVKTALGRTIPLRLYSLPAMWQRMQAEAGWGQLKADVVAFNATNMWRKRGLAMLPTRYAMMRGRKPAYVSLLSDGSVQVACHGVEMGQGLWTKVAQVAASTLSEVLPPSRRPMDMNAIRIADNSTELLPNGGVTAGSTTSEMACAAVRLACLKLVDNLKEYALPKLAGRADFGLRDLVAAVSMGAMGSMAPLSAFAWGGQANLPESSSADAPGPVDPQYHVLGVALALAEVDVLTGERRLLRCDIMFDLGRPTNPAVDLGQVEGAFVQGLGMMLQEEATYDSTTGALVQNSTWSYKPPSVSCVPAQLNITLLNDAPLASGGPVSSKACGEPPLLLSFVALAALQRATAEARRCAGGGGGGGGSTAGDFVPLMAPATVERVRLACGGRNPAELLRQAGL